MGAAENRPGGARFPGVGDHGMQDDYIGLQLSPRTRAGRGLGAPAPLPLIREMDLMFQIGRVCA